MHALVLTSLLPNTGPDRSGIARRLRMLIDGLDGVADTVEVAHLAPQEAIAACPDPDNLARLQSAEWGRPVTVSLLPRDRRESGNWAHYGRGLFNAAAQPDFAAIAGPQAAAAVGRVLDGGHDLVVVHRLAVMCSVLRAGRKLRNVVFDLDDVEHRARLRRLTHSGWRPGLLAQYAQLPALIAAERQAAGHVSRILVSAPNDAECLSWQGLRRKFVVIPNAVELPAQPPPLPGTPNILLLGQFSHAPNRAAAERMVGRIFPLIRRAAPDARLLLAGDGSTALPFVANAPDGVTSLGYVDDLAGLYAQSRVICCPLTWGAGTRVKLVEAAAYRRPMAATRMAVEGLNFRHDKEVLLAEDDDALAAACVRLLRDDDLSQRLAQAARRQAEEHYDRNAVVARLRGLYREVAVRAEGQPAGGALAAR